MGNIKLEITKKEVRWKNYTFPLLPRNKSEFVKITMEDYKFLKENKDKWFNSFPSTIYASFGILNDMTPYVNIFKKRKKNERMAR